MAPPTTRRMRALVALLALTIVYAGVTTSGALDHFDAEHLRRLVRDAGPWGVLLYVILFSVGQLLHIPGLLLQAAGILAWGRVVGFGVSFGAALMSVSVTFVVVRGVAGAALAEVDRPWVKRLLERLETRPVVTVALVRTAFWLSPWSTYALALSRVRYRDFLIGSAIGLLLPLATAAFVMDWLFTA